MKVIGLTGGIGSGKSTISKYLTENEIVVLDADEIAREIVIAGSDVLKNLTECFGNEILCDDGSLNRKKLGSIVFADPAKKMKLDHITHGKIIERIQGKLEKARNQRVPLVVLDAPLLFETGLNQLVEQVWLVDVKDEIRIRRVMKRDGLSKEEVQARIAQQMDSKQRRKQSHVILDNSGDREGLYAQVDCLLLKLQSN